MTLMEKILEQFEEYGLRVEVKEIVEREGEVQFYAKQPFEDDFHWVCTAGEDLLNGIKCEYLGERPENLYSIMEIISMCMPQGPFRIRIEEKDPITVLATFSDANYLWRYTSKGLWKTMHKHTEFYEEYTAELIKQKVYTDVTYRRVEETYNDSILHNALTREVSIPSDYKSSGDLFFARINKDKYTVETIFVKDGTGYISEYHFGIGEDYLLYMFPLSVRENSDMSDPLVRLLHRKGIWNAPILTKEERDIIESIHTHQEELPPQYAGERFFVDHEGSTFYMKCEEQWSEITKQTVITQSVPQAVRDEINIWLALA